MKHGSLFSGIGGFDLAAEWMGWENVFHCEWNEFGQKILKHYWPNAKSYGDITKTDFTEWNGRIDIVSGGFPCQPFSTSGKRKGNSDDRYLWPEMLRAVSEIRPTWIVGENVHGIANWNKGMVFEKVQADLEAAGYQSQAYVLPACAVGAQHRRDRVWFIGHISNTGGVRCGGIDKLTEGHKCIDRGAAQCFIKPLYRRGDRFYRFDGSEIIRDSNGLSGELDKDRIKALGNSIVPQVAYEIFKAIEEFEKLNSVQVRNKNNAKKH